MQLQLSEGQVVPPSLVNGRFLGFNYNMLTGFSAAELALFQQTLIDEPILAARWRTLGVGAWPVPITGGSSVVFIGGGVDATVLTRLDNAESRITTIEVSGGGSTDPAVLSRLNDLEARPTVEPANVVTVPVPGGVATFGVTNVFPAGSRGRSLLVRVSQTLGNSQGLTTFSVGDPGAGPGLWVDNMARTVGTQSTEADNDTLMPISNITPRTVTINADAGLFDGTGELVLTAIYSAATPS